VELQRNLNAIRQQGLGLAAISYDSVAVLKNFTDRQHITFPLLSDPESKIIRAFDILNETVAPGTAFYGIPNPGTYVLDPQGRVVSKHFEDDYRERVSATDILIQDFGKSADAVREVAETKHLRLTTTASTPVARPGHRIVLSLEIDLKPKMHVYAPGVQGYIPIEWKLEEGVAGKLQPVAYPLGDAAPGSDRRDRTGISRPRDHQTRDHIWSGSRSEATGQSGRRIDAEGIIPVSGVR
jgi:AhpC/TSA family